MKDFSKLLSQLNPPQREAAEYLDGPLLILAGAGSGKTRVLTYRIANLIATGAAQPFGILAVTFTNKAAQEMKARALGLLEDIGIPFYSEPWIYTFHSFCAQILRADIHYMDYSNSFTIYDRTDQLSMIKKAFTIHNLDTKTYSPKVFLNQINEFKIQGMDPDDAKDEAVHNVDEHIANVYATYEEEMKNANCLDFEDLLRKTVVLFKNYPEVLKRYQDQFTHIMVDEYQDTNSTQYEIVKMLSETHRNLCAVGDEDQSIYSWRGADIQNILSFESDFPETKVVKLEENYRSTQNIVDAASAVIRNNVSRKDKTLFTNKEEGSLITLRELGDDYAEARFITDVIQRQLDQGEHNYEDFSVFYRTNAQSRVLEEQLRSRGIPYKLIGGQKFYERMEIKDLISYLRLLLNAKDDMAFLRILNVPARGIGKVTQTKIQMHAANSGLSYLESAHEMVQGGHFNKGTATKIQKFLTLYSILQQEIKDLTPSETFDMVLDRTEYIEHLRYTKPEDATSRIDNINELHNAISKFEEEREEDEVTLTNFLEEVALISDADKVDESEEGVKLMTLHVSKGLEFPVVFMVGMEEGLFPSFQSIDSLDTMQMEEERRICYVGMTRAMEKLYLTYTKKRRHWGQQQHFLPSRFLKEIPEEYLDRKVNTPPKPKYDYEPGFQDDMSFDEFPDYESGEQEAGFKKGMKVRHPTFGVGTISKTEGTGLDQKVTIMFPRHATKKFIVRYARLERI